jgi:hypothetical protein
MIYIIGMPKVPSPLIVQIFFKKKFGFRILYTMEDQRPNFIDRALKTVEIKLRHPFLTTTLGVVYLF